MFMDLFIKNWGLFLCFCFSFDFYSNSLLLHFAKVSVHSGPENLKSWPFTKGSLRNTGLVNSFGEVKGCIPYACPLILWFPCSRKQGLRKLKCGVQWSDKSRGWRGLVLSGIYSHATQQHHLEIFLQTLKWCQAAASTGDAKDKGNEF